MPSGLKEKVFDLNFAADSKKNIRNVILKLADLPKATSAVFVNAHVIVESHWDLEFKNMLQKADVIVPDGVPVAWVLHALGRKEAQRYSGPDLMMDVFAETKNKRHFFLGSTPETLDKIKARFEKEMKHEAAGFYSPPFSQSFNESEKEKQIKLVQSCGADFVWVGLGAPKQEKHVVEMATRPGSRGVWLAVGAAFDFYAGTKPRSPEFLQKMGMEWAYRMASEPKRLAFRYLKTNPVFVKLALEEIAVRKRS